jgi:hypothetical protein
MFEEGLQLEICGGMLVPEQATPVLDSEHYSRWWLYD